MTAPSRKLAIVTGTTSGIGQKVADELLDRNWTVVGLARREALRSHAAYRHVRVDLAALADVMSILESQIAAEVASAAWERVGLVNNAASPELLAPIEALDALDLAELHAVNLVAPVWLMGFVSRHCRRDVPLRIVNVSSGAAVRAFPGLGAYGSAKAGLRMAGMVLAAEWASTAEHAPSRGDAMVVSYQPGAVDTPMQAAARAQRPEAFPWVGMFTAMRDQGVLVEPREPALEIVSLLESAGDGPPAFIERRLGQ